ncbi:MAG: mechanosensitive ion channel [archaeon]|nr:mechanosensitive ion channel [archaeon]
MYKCRAATLVAIFAVITLFGAGAIVTSDDSSASNIDGTSLVLVYDTNKSFVVNANNEVTFTLNLFSNYSDTRILYIHPSCSNELVNVYADPSITLTPGKFHEVDVTVAADKFARQGEYTVSLKMDVRDSTDASQTGVANMDLSVRSNLSANEQYNRFMGIWDNDFPSPLDGAWFAALVTCIVWLAIGFAVRLVAVPVVMKIIMKKDDPDYNAMKTTLVRMCFVIVVLNGIGKAIRVLGASEGLIDMINIWFYICYVIVGAMVAWRLYILIITTVVKRIGTRDFIPGGSKSDFESLKPLLIYIGEILLTVISVGTIMSLLGFDMTAIITGAGIISLGITMGAQSVLSQFFSGLVILATRPFKKGDLITINGSSVTYRVRKVNVMNTELENWDNTDITIVPNNTITSGLIKNITRDTLKSKVHVFISVGYGTDLAFARETMLEVANANPRIIKDGSVSRPSTRVTDFEDSNIQMRLSFYVDDFNDSGVIGGEVRQALYNKFCEKHINIDYTQIVVRPAPANED